MFENYFIAFMYPKTTKLGRKTEFLAAIVQKFIFPPKPDPLSLGGGGYGVMVALTCKKIFHWIYIPIKYKIGKKN